MAMTSPFSSLEHAIIIARDTWFRKMYVRCWLEVISGRSCSNQYLETANEVTMQEFHECGSMYEEKFRTSEDILTELNTRFTNTHVVELDITSKQEMKYIELHITELLSKKSAQTTDKGDAEYSAEIVNDTLNGAETDSKDNLDYIFSSETDISRKFELNKVLKEDNETLDTQQRQDDVLAAKRGFNLNKKPWFGDDLSNPLLHEGCRFLTKYFLPGQYDVDEIF
ncbi:hypothetical protein Ahy_B05g075749 [Arachis hypogaea]|uniref:Oxo-4-hydroxy-4-carboxy-5-ureidoimidazoline decarboxylase domain-containing protein n=1 Tax=Arachis hypogaea TaxID=3818 RepID=A0A444Z1Y4_ARAHY|nr:hypothetical protein Ahy_B05g075749 [Arachis hypogaea]